MNALNAESPTSTVTNPSNAESAVSADPAPSTQAPHNKKGLIIIGIFKLLKGASLLILALGMLHLLHHDVQEWAEDLISRTRFDPDNRHIAAVLGKLGLVDDTKIREFSGLGAIYAALFLTEGVGLIRQKRWAEYLTTIATASLIPLELYEVYLRASWVRVLFFVGNVAILAYLLTVIRKNGEAHVSAPREEHTSAGA